MLEEQCVIPEIISENTCDDLRSILKTPNNNDIDEISFSDFPDDFNPVKTYKTSFL